MEDLGIILQDCCNNTRKNQYSQYKECTDSNFKFFCNPFCNIRIQKARDTRNALQKGKLVFQFIQIKVWLKWYKFTMKTLAMGFGRNYSFSFSRGFKSNRKTFFWPQIPTGKLAMISVRRNEISNKWWQSFYSNWKYIRKNNRTWKYQFHQIVPPIESGVLLNSGP